MKDADLVALVSSLPMAAALSKNHELRRAYLQRYKHEVAVLLSHLQRIKIIGHAAPLHPDPPGSCDTCGTDLTKKPWFVDSEHAGGAWANMCPTCFLDSEGAIGWGVGQIYFNHGNNIWRLLGGGDPDKEMGD